MVKLQKAELAPQTTEIAILARGKKIKTISLKLGDVKVSSQQSIKYLGIHLNDNPVHQYGGGS